MQLQIECNSSSSKSQHSCVLCSQVFQSTEARVIVCNDRGNRYGDICADCLKRGSDWIWHRLLSDRDRIRNHPKPLATATHRTAVPPSRKSQKSYLN